MEGAASRLRPSGIRLWPSLLPFSVPCPQPPPSKHTHTHPKFQTAQKARGPFEVFPLQISGGRSKGPPGSPKPKHLSSESRVLLPHTIESDYDLLAIKSVPGRKCEIHTGNGRQYEATLPSPTPFLLLAALSRAGER